MSYALGYDLKMLKKLPVVSFEWVKNSSQFNESSI